MIFVSACIRHAKIKKELLALNIDNFKHELQDFSSFKTYILQRYVNPIKKLCMTSVPSQPIGPTRHSPELVNFR